MDGIVHTFPSEILSQIFAEVKKTSNVVPPFVTVRLSHVCHQWREAAIGDSNLWHEIGVVTRDVHHVSVIAQLLRRSRQRTIAIGMRFDEQPALEDIPEFRCLVFFIISHVSRARYLSIYAPRETWQIITVALGSQAFPNLSLLDLELIVPRTAGPQIHSTHVSANGLSVAHHPRPPPPVVFRLPFSHPSLYMLRLSGIALDHTVFSNLKVVCISGNATKNLLKTHGDLSPWLLQGPVGLCFEDMQIPPMRAYDAQPIDERGPSTIRHLILSKLSATPRNEPDEEGYFEHSCWSFFDSLYTPLVCYLQIDRWDLNGRSWTDFLDWLPEDIRFPCVVELHIFGMHFHGMGYEIVQWFLGSFPGMRHLRLQDCWPGTWEIVLEVLQMDATLCPDLQSIRLHDNLAVLRNDPLPFAREVADGGI